VVLRFGETLDDVARAHGSSVRELRRLNGVKETLELHGGMSIVVPRRAVATKEKDKDKDKDADRQSDKPATADTAVDDDTVLVAVPDRSFSYDGRERVFYRTRDGDGLDEIADVFGVRNEDLCEWNNLDPTAKLHPRMVLQIFVRKDFDPAGVLLLDPAKVRVVTCGSEEFLELETARRGKKRLYYTAKSGDTLAKLGRRYGLTPGDLARINRFSYNTELHEGDRIVVYSPAGDAPREVTRGMTPGEKRPGRATATSTTMTGGAHKPGAAPEHKPPSPGSDAKKKVAAATAKPAAAKPAPHAKPAAPPAAGKKK
jgi:membrane-bound lytic murein transglycosylase D